MNSTRWPTSVGAAIAIALCVGLLSSCAYISRASQDDNGVQANGASEFPVLSAGGRWTVFESSATNLVPGDTNGVPDVFVRDNHNRTIARVSVATNGAEGNAWSGQESASQISADGRFVVFVSAATNLVPSDLNDFQDVFRRDRDTDHDGIFDEPGAVATVLVSKNVSGASSDYASSGARVSADGSIVAFSSPASTLVTAPDRDTNGVDDVFAATLDAVTGQVTQMRVVSRPDPGTESNGSSFGVDMNSTGTAFAFVTDATNMLPADTNGKIDVVVNIGPGTLYRGTGAVQANETQLQPSISEDGTLVAYETFASNLAPDDTNGSSDVFVTDVVTGVTTIDSPPVPVTNLGGGGGDEAVLSADGTRVAFKSYARDLTGDGTDGQILIFVRDRVSQRTQVVSTGASLVTANGSSFGTMSKDGRYVAFATAATNIVAPDTNGAPDLFVRAALVPAVDNAFALDPVSGSEVGPLLHPGPNRMRIYGAFFGPVSAVVLGTGTTVSVTSVAPNQIELDVTVAPGTPAGPRNIVVTNAGSPAVGDIGAWGSCQTCATIAAS